MSALLLTSFQVALRSAQADPDLLQFIDSCVDNCCHDVQCRVSDKQILQRQLTGFFAPGVSYVKGNNKRGSAAADSNAPSAKMFRQSQQSAISDIVSKPYAPAPKGKSDHLPQNQKKYCTSCNKWIAIGTFGQHEGAKIHKDNVTSGVLFKWCTACNMGFANEHECSAVSN